MVKTEQQTATHVSVSAIFFAALIGLSFTITFATFGGAIAMSIGLRQIEKPGTALMVFIGIAGILLLTSTYFIAGFIASRVSHQRFRFDSIIHSLGTWAVMSILLVSIVSTAALYESVRRGLGSLQSPMLVTDMEIFKAKAVTTIQTSEKKPDKPTKADKEADKLLALAWWIAFLSLVFGSAASVSGGLLARE